MYDSLKITSVTIIFLSVLFCFASPAFFTWPNILNILTASSTIGILAIGTTFVLGANGLDLSIGSLMALCAIFAVTIFPDSSFMIILFCLFFGSFFGAINGWIIAKLNLPPFIVTLAALSLYRGLALIISDGRPVYGLSEFIVFLGQGSFLGLPVPIWLFFCFGLLGHILLQWTKFGHQCLAVGDNEEAAKNNGIKIVRLKIYLYSLSGLAAAIAGILFMGRVNAADPSAGIMYELAAITAVIIGGTSLSGGKATVIGSVLGALLMGILQNGLTLLNMASYYQQLTIGLVLILAMIISSKRVSA